MCMLEAEQALDPLLIDYALAGFFQVFIALGTVWEQIDGNCQWPARVVWQEKNC